jgi:hypothetical protein
MQQHNVVVFERSIAYHAAAHHVLALALTKLVAKGTVSAADAKGTLTYAERNMDVGELRHTIGLALSELKASAQRPLLVSDETIDTRGLTESSQ